MFVFAPLDPQIILSRPSPAILQNADNMASTYIIPFKGFEKGFVSAVSEKVSVDTSVLSSSITENPVVDARLVTMTAEICSRMANNLVYMQVSLSNPFTQAELLARVLEPALVGIKESIANAMDNSIAEMAAGSAPV